MRAEWRSLAHFGSGTASAHGPLRVEGPELIPIGGRNVHHLIGIDAVQARPQLRGAGSMVKELRELLLLPLFGSPLLGCTSAVRHTPAALGNSDDNPSGIAAAVP